MCLFTSDWSQQMYGSRDFEYLPDDTLNARLQEFFCGVVQKDGKTPYSKSGMVNIRASLNRCVNCVSSHMISNNLVLQTIQISNHPLQ